MITFFLKSKMSGLKIEQNLDLFDEDVLMLADRDPFLQEYANIDKFRSTKYYIKTSFHKKILALLTTKKQNLDEKIDYMNGIQGMGKTASLIYFVLQCLKRNEKSTHYIDLEVVKDDKNKIKSLTESDASNSKGCLIIDHCSLDNFTLLNEIKNVFRKKGQIIVLETDFAASFHAYALELGKDMQLTEEEFSSIWNVSFSSVGEENSESPIGKGREVCSFINGQYIISPRLLKYFQTQILYGRSIADAYTMYEIYQRNRIQEFTITGDRV